MKVPKLSPVFFLLTELTFQQCSDAESKKDTLFQKMDSTATNITFRNMLSPRINKFSIVDYLYYYNGAGVATGDVNNDGLTDLFFVSNQHENKLYLNKGNFQFEDISAKAGIEGFAGWKTGVTMADVNGDSFLDIYVCAIGDYMGLEGSNELYINNGNGTFTEQSSAYGLDFTGFSTQAAFFDYDHDGDLDMYLLTHGKFISRSYTNVIANLLSPGEAVDFLFRNDGEKFKDVSDETGIRKAGPGYGLGISIADLDNDGWEDIYVTNDFYENDNCFLNNHDGTFREQGKQLFGHYSHFTRGCDIADMNNDGFEDVMTTEMSSQDETIEKTSFQSDPLDVYHSKLALGYHSQFPRNCLQINNGGRNFSDQALLSGVASTDYSWSTLLADYDNDGYKDIFITTGSAARLNNLEYLAFARFDSMRYAPQLSEHQLDRNMKRIPERKFHNYLYKGSSDLTFEDRSAEWGMQAEGLANGAAWSDLDNDGDLDLVTNNINEAPGIYRNRSNELTRNNYVTVQLTGQGKNTFGVGAKIYLISKGGSQLQHISASRGYLSSSDLVAHFGIGANNTVDSLVVVWNDGKTQVLTSVAGNKKILLDHRDAKDLDVSGNGGRVGQFQPLVKDITPASLRQYVHRENKYSDFYREKLIPFLVSTEGPKITVGDVNHDGLDDFYIGGAKYQPGTLVIQQPGGEFDLSAQRDFLKDSIYEDTDAAFFDADHDNDLDLYVVTGGNEFFGEMDKQFDRLYRNDGTGHFLRDEGALPKMFENKSCARPYDFDGDGDLDVFVGGRVTGYNYGKAPRSYLLSNDGKGKFSDVTATMAPGLERAGMVTDAAWTDTDGDGDADLVIAGDWMPLKVFENTGGSFIEVKDIIDPQSPIKSITGWWQCLLTNDFDGDGDMDLIAGNLGTNTTLRKNGDQSKVKMYSGDLDADNKNDQVVAYNRPDGKFYPAASMADFAMQLPSVTEKFPVSSDFAGKSVDELFTIMNIHPPEPIIADQFATLYFENSGKNKFVVRKLPNEIQTSKVFSLATGDFNDDGHLDVLAGGNFIGGSIYQGAYDASHGVLMTGDGKGNFTIVPMERSGLNLDGETRDVKLINTKAGAIYVIGKNNGPIQVLVTKSGERK